jgi:hypothetical protein
LRCSVGDVFEGKEVLYLLLDDLEHRGKDGKLFSENLLELGVGGLEV